MGNVLKCIRRHTDEYHLEETPIPDVIEVIVSQQIQAINEVIDLVSDSDTEIQPIILEGLVLELSVDEGASTMLQVSSLGSKEESVTEEQVKDEA